MFDYQSRRRIVDKTMLFLCGFAAFLAMVPLINLLYFVTSKGIGTLGPGAKVLGTILLMVAMAYVLRELIQAFDGRGRWIALLAVGLPFVWFLAVDFRAIGWANSLWAIAAFLLAAALKRVPRDGRGLRMAWVLVGLGLPFLYVLAVILGKVDWGFFIHLPTPVGVPGGGMSNSIVGTITIVLIACGVGLPIGIFSGVYLAEFGKKGSFAWTVRFVADVLSGVPSIVTGIVAYALLVKTMGHFSAFAGGVALGFMMIPVVTRTTEELIKMVPHSIREASWALGVPEWRTILSIVMRTAKNGILTGVLLSIARIAGETAPLLFTAFSNHFWPPGISKTVESAKGMVQGKLGFGEGLGAMVDGVSKIPADLGQPTASLTVQVFTYAIAPFEDWQAQAWTGAFVLLLMVLSVNLFARMAFKNRRDMLRG